MKKKNTRKLRTMQVFFISPYIHFDPMTASGNVVLARELARCASKIAKVTVITGITKGGYPDPISGSLACYRGLLEAVHKGINIAHLIDIPIPLLPIFYRRIALGGGKLIYHIWYNPMLNVKSWLYINMLKRFADIIACTSPQILEILSKVIDYEKLYLIPPPIDTDLYKPLTGIESSDDRPSILYMGSLHPSRFPLIEIFRAFKRLHEEGLEVNLRVVGAPKHRFDSMVLLKLKRLSEKANLEKYISVTYQRIPPSDRVKLFNKSDIVLFPFTTSVRDVVDPPITMLEAMSCGRIIVASKTLSISSIIKDEFNGFLCTSYKSEYIYKSIKRAIRIDSRMRNTIMTRARDTIQKLFSHTKMQDHLKKIYEKLS